MAPEFLVFRFVRKRARGQKTYFILFIGEMKKDESLGVRGEVN